MAKITLDSRYTKADIKIDQNGTKFIDWFGDLKFDVEDFDENIQYQVKPNDTVFTIASQYYGSQRYYWAVCRANLIFNPFKKLVAGTKIILISNNDFNSTVLGEQ